METVIPPKVLEHLTELASGSRNPFAGGFTTLQVAEHLDITTDAAREVVRRLLKNGMITGRRQGISQEIAQRFGYLAGCSVPVYYLKKEA